MTKGTIVSFLSDEYWMIESWRKTNEIGQLELAKMERTASRAVCTVNHISKRF
jgi:hypothetical protein